jgi:hypothetical protein
LSKNSSVKAEYVSIDVQSNSNAQHVLQNHGGHHTSRFASQKSFAIPNDISARFELGAMELHGGSAYKTKISSQESERFMAVSNTVGDSERSPRPVRTEMTPSTASFPTQVDLSHPRSGFSPLPDVKAENSLQDRQIGALRSTHVYELEGDSKLRITDMVTPVTGPVYPGRNEQTQILMIGL